MKIKLLGKTPEQIADIVMSEGLPKYTAGQILQWLYKKRVRSIEQMTNLSKHAREQLSSKYIVGVEEYLSALESTDGTKKYLFRVNDEMLAKYEATGWKDTAPMKGNEGTAVEAVMIPDEERSTICVSSQSGCKMACHFCMTGRQGFHGSLSVAEILNQFYSIDEADKLTNAVFMGMGEPLDNYDNVMAAINVLTADWGFGWSPKRITLSTVGVLPKLKRFLDESRCHLAVSIHNPFPDERQSIMPVQKAWNITDVIALLREYDFSGQRRVSFEYTMFAGFNDDKRHADALSRALRGIECRVNLIRFHKIPDFPYECASNAAIELFKERMNANGITTTIRASRGEDILAACGMLAGKHSKENKS